MSEIKKQTTVISGIQFPKLSKQEELELKNAISLSKLNKEMHPLKIDQSYGKMSKHLFGSRFKLYSIKYIVASILLLILGQLSTYIFSPFSTSNSKSNLLDLKQNYTIVSTELGQSSTIQLPDGSTVKLNSGSTLSYSNFDQLKMRRVRLDGEGLFVVNSDSTRRFVVETDELEFSVYGTTFNIEAYHSDSTTKATLLEGSIGVNRIGQKEFVRLKPNQVLLTSKYTQKSSLTTIDNDVPITWPSGVVEFKNLPLAVIAKKIERWYNVQVIFNNPKRKQRAYSGALIKDKPVHYFLEALKGTQGYFKYSIVSKKNSKNIIYIN